MITQFNNSTLLRSQQPHAPIRIPDTVFVTILAFACLIIYIKNQMSQTLLFIPDISGFTEFVNNTAVEHSHHIIAELLEKLIDANELGLELVEVEGDALFFHREGDLPSLPELMSQVERMTVAFHQHLMRYNHQRICQCGACKTAVNLKLKFVAHSGPMQYIEVAGRRKPYGKDVIQVHRLLKNQVPTSEYLLVSHYLADRLEKWDEHKHQFRHLKEQYDGHSVPYFYQEVSKFRQDLPPPELRSISFETTNPLTLDLHVDRAPEELFEVISNFKYRKLWNTEPDFLFEESHLNRAGMTHVCIVDEREILFETVKKGDSDNPFVYGEKTRDIPMMEYVSSYFSVEENNQGSYLRFELYLKPKSFAAKILTPFIKTQARRRSRKLLEQLKSVAEGKADLKLQKSVET